MIPCLADVTLLAAPLADSWRAAREAGFEAIEVWLTKLETALKEQPAEQLLALRTELGLKLVAAAYQGGLLLSQGAERREHFNHFQRRLSLCQEFGIPVLLVVPDHAEKLTALELERACVSLKQAAQLAASFDVKLALEFRGSSRWCATLPTALHLVAACAEPNLGVCLDLFHFYTGASKFEDLGQLDPRLLFHVQLCDVAGVARELASDSDRILPGDGDFQVQPLLDHLRRVGWAGSVAVELMNPQLWEMKAPQVAATAWSSLRPFGLTS
ncbi:MAG TPA: sugar phosphate isomerase/epimerase [Gemmatales bacterium]|nr:sugar phosphate isomerase/epimerase [Gemmatales bacterium]HMP59577.1 sugar phosphate isomerase/epimerase [Gemmatales bacterium]